MDLVVRQFDRGGVPGLSVAGEVDMATAPRLRDALVQLAAEYPGVTAVIDLDGVSFLDSLGLGVLVGGLRRMRTTGGDLALDCTSPGCSTCWPCAGSTGSSRSTPAWRRRPE